MLIEFSVGNYRSFKEVVTFSMVAANLQAQDKAVDENNTFAVNDKLRLLKSAAVYGANASGKTNLVKALQFMKAFVQNSSKDTQAEEPIDADAFLLNEATVNEPSFFQIVFRIGSVQYRYGFKVNAERIVSEWLFYVPRTKEASLFQRTQDEGITVGDKYSEGKGLETRTRSNALFLSVVAQFNGRIAQEILEWFFDCGIVTETDPRRQFSRTMRLLTNDTFAGSVKDFIRDLDLDLRDIFVETREIYVDEFSPEMSEEARRRYESGPKLNIREIRTLHRQFNAEGVPSGWKVFDALKQESDGTKKLIAFAGILVPALKTGGVLFIDELDARLHPLITCAIICLFNSAEKNPHNAQLVFTTHDTNLLSKDLFRRDQIWFAEKDRQGATHLYSLAEFRGVRNDSSYEADYIHGRFGAIPFLGDFNRVFGASEAQNGAEK